MAQSKGFHGWTVVYTMNRTGAPTSSEPFAGRTHLMSKADSIFILLLEPPVSRPRRSIGETLQMALP